MTDPGRTRFLVDQRVLDAVLTEIERTGSAKTACATVGIHPRTLQKHCAADAALAERVAEARRTGREANAVHGAPYTYQRGCRCQECVQAASARARRYRKGLR